MADYKLQGYYRLNESSDFADGLEAKDISGRKRDGEYFDKSGNGDTQFIDWVHPVSGEKARGLELHGKYQSDGVKLPDARKLKIEKSDYSISCWALLPEDGADGSEVMVSIVSGMDTKNRIWLYTRDMTSNQTTKYYEDLSAEELAALPPESEMPRDGKCRVRIMSTKFTGTSNYMCSSAPDLYSRGEPVNIVMTCEAKDEGNDDWKHTYNLYINGKKAADEMSSGVVAPIGWETPEVLGEGEYADDITIGGDLDNHNYDDLSNFFSGLIADVAIWNKVLTPTQIKAVYESGVCVPFTRTRIIA